MQKQSPSPGQKVISLGTTITMHWTEFVLFLLFKLIFRKLKEIKGTGQLEYRMQVKSYLSKNKNKKNAGEKLHP